MISPFLTVASGTDITIFLSVTCAIGFIAAVVTAWLVTKKTIAVLPVDSEHQMLNSHQGQPPPNVEELTEALERVYNAISDGAIAFLRAEYLVIGIFIIVFSVILFFLLGHSITGLFSALSFAIGGCTSLLCGYIGMRVAVYSNARVTSQAQRGLYPAFQLAFRAGSVVGFLLVSLGLLILLATIGLFYLHFHDSPAHLMEAVAGYGLGGSSIAMFGRIGGGIYTKAADVGADLAGKIDNGIPEDDPRNPATIADNVGDNVGDVAGMSADLFGSLAEALSSALVISGASADLSKSFGSLLFPLTIPAAGMIVGLLVSFLVELVPIKKNDDIEKSLKYQLTGCTILSTPVIYGLTVWCLPAEFTVGSGSSVTKKHAKNWYAFICVLFGLWGGLIIGWITEFFTSHRFKPTQEVAGSCTSGAGPVIIYGIALGYKSVMVPVLVVAVSIFVCFALCGMYGIALAALGVLAVLATSLAIDVFGPICDNAGGLAELCRLPATVRNRTDALDAAGNTTAAIGKGFAIGSACLVAIALWGAFVTRSKITVVNILAPYELAGLILGASLPYLFCAMIMKSVGFAAQKMVEEVRRQILEIDGLLTGGGNPNYERCVNISTNAALKEMLLPSLLVMITPIGIGAFFGVHAVAGLLVGIFSSGLMMAISQSNSGGAWDNAKKYVELGNFGGKNSKAHTAAVTGDVVGDPFKDSSGPAVNVLMKLSAILSLVCVPFFMSIYGGQGLIGHWLSG